MPTERCQKRESTSSSDVEWKGQVKLGKRGQTYTSRDRRDYFRDYYHKYKEARRESDRLSVLRRKLKVLDHYGGVCSCCGESWPVFLTMDHIHGGGNAHRRTSSDVKVIYRWLVRNNYPPGFQVLCFNCNFAKHVKKVCPHQSTNGRNPHAAPIPSLDDDNRVAPGGRRDPDAPS